MSPIRSDYTQADTLAAEHQNTFQEIHGPSRTHGDAMKGVALEADDVKILYINAASVQEPITVSDKDGELATATIKTYVGMQIPFSSAPDIIGLSYRVTAPLWHKTRWQTISRPYRLRLSTIALAIKNWNDMEAA